VGVPGQEEESLPPHWGKVLLQSLCPSLKPFEMGVYPKKDGRGKKKGRGDPDALPGP
jgi:hypothetical protein